MQQPQASKRLGELLLERRLITPRQLDQALQQQRVNREFLGVILVKAGAITQEALVKVFAEQFGLPYESLDPAKIDWNVARQFPSAAMTGAKCFPIRADASSVTVAITNPLDAMTLSELERLAKGRTVKPVLVQESQLEAVALEHKRRALQALEARLNQHGNPQGE
jgi:hypothetical protein